MIKMLRESDDKITARTYDQLISKLEKRGYDCKDCYEGDDYLYLRKDGDSYEAEYYKKDNGTYELYLGDIHPAKKTEGCCGKCHKKESVNRKSRRGLNEDLDFYTESQLDRLGYIFDELRADDGLLRESMDNLDKLSSIYYLMYVIGKASSDKLVDFESAVGENMYNLYTACKKLNKVTDDILKDKQYRDYI